MRITGVWALLLSYVYRKDEAWKWSGGNVDVWNTCSVEVRTDEGITGLGYIAAGYRTVKIRGGYSARQSAALMELARRAVGDDVEVMIDAGQHYVLRPRSLAEAIEVARAIEPFRPFWLEEPLHIEQRREYAALREKMVVPIASGENGATLWEFQGLLEVDALDVLQPDVRHAGGIGEVKHIAQAAELYNRKIAPHVFRSGVGLMAHLHLMCAAPNGLIFEHSQIPNPLRDELLVSPVTVQGGCIEAPLANVSGLGVHLPAGIEELHPYRGHVQRFAVEVNT